MEEEEASKDSRIEKGEDSHPNAAEEAVPEQEAEVEGREVVQGSDKVIEENEGTVQVEKEAEGQQQNEESGQLGLEQENAAEGQQEDEGEAQQEDEEEEQQIASFPEEDSMSRDSAALQGDGLGGDESRDADQNDEGSSDPMADNKMDFVDEGQSMDGISVRSEEQNAIENVEANKCSASDSVVGEESNDSKISCTSETSKEKEALQDQIQNVEGDNGISDLMAHETMLDDEEEGENVVAEVDISSMMEINFDEESENSQGQTNQDIANDGDDEPEVIPIDSDDETSDANKRTHQNGESEDSRPVVLGVDEVVYQVDDEDNVTQVSVSSMMQVAEEASHGRRNDDLVSSGPTSSLSRRPRRAAAEAAAKTIHQISTAEQGIPSNVFRTRRKSQEDREFNVHEEERNYESQSPSTKQQCLVCKKSVPCSIVVRQYGSDIYLCSNTCFNKFRNQGKDSRHKTLPCSKCGIMEGESHTTNAVYFWETMNFCSDLCVGRYQMDVGSKCCTCGNNVPWNSLGKYCVRFGSDIRQFCTPQCLEGYKKNARVCFNCQLDIRRVGNVILANIPSKNSAKEFCSNDCVEMYCDRNMHQPTRAKPQPEHFCNMCQTKRPVHREIVLTTGSVKTCSESCWQDALHAKGVSKAEKCQMCTKFVNMDLGFTTPVYWLSTMNRIFGFCSHVCKNLYILNSRKILSCTSCKVKKYNFDLIEYFTNSSSDYAVCSLACLPKGADYLKNIRDVLYIPQPTSDRSTLNLGASFPVINSVSSIPVQPEERTRNRNRRKQFNGGTTRLGESEVIELDDDDDDDDDQEITIGDSDRILDILSIEEIEAVVKFLEHRPTMRDMKCMAKPKTRTVETQTDVSELNEMDRITLVPEDVVHYVPVPIPTLIHVPFPGYFLESPVPVPFPVPIPIPIPIPIIIPTEKKSSTVTAKETRKDDDDDSDNAGKDKDTATKTHVNLGPKTAPTNTTTGTAGTSATSEPSSDKQSDKESTIKPNSKEITAEYHHQNTLGKSGIPSNVVTPTPSISTTPPDFSRRGSGSSSHSNYPSPNYSQETFQSSIYPSPISNYSPTYGSSPVPPLTPVAPIPPVAVPPMMNHTPPMRDYGSPPIPPSMVTQMSPVYSPYEVPPRPYMPSAPAPMIRSPVMPVASGYGTHSSTTSMGYVNAPPPSLPISTIIPQPPSPKNARVENALRAWKMMFGPSSDPRSISSIELSSKLCDLVNRGSKPNGERYRADILLYISLGIQQLLRDNNRVDKIFYDNMYYNFVLAFTDRAERELTVGIHAKLEEIHFWETSELGATSPGVLLFTLIFMLYKHFGLKTWEMHSALQFSNIVIQSRYNHFGRCVKYMTVVGMPGVIPTEVPEDVTTPDRCLIKMYEFYCFKSEIRNGPFYKCLRQDYTPRTPWFTSQQLDQRHIYQMLVRATMIINNSDSFS